MKVNLWRNVQSPTRPRTGQSTIRGKTISHPIPIPSPLDSEFPVHSLSTGGGAAIGVNESDWQPAPPPPGPSPLPIALNQEPRIASGSSLQQVPSPSPSPMPMPIPVPSHPEREAPAAPVHLDPMSRDYHTRGQSFSATLPRPSTSPPRSGNSPPRHQSSPPRPHDSSPRRTIVSRTNINSTVRYSVVSAASTGQTGQSRDGPLRKKSTLRTAWGRLFGRKKKIPTSSTANSTDENLAHLRNTSQHRSTLLPTKDPTALGNRPIDRDRGSEPKRSASLPITEFDRALRSHSIGPDDITAIESARNSIQADVGAGRRRAATTTSRLLQIQRIEGWSGLSPRPASTHGRGSRLLSGIELDGSDVNHDPDEIGRAITSDIGSRRRSRSLSGLENIETHRADIRKRSDEIRYWRESYGPGFMSPLSSNAPDGDNDGETVGDGEGDGGGEGQDTRGNPSTGLDGNIAMPETSGTRHRLDAGRTPPQPFTFPRTVASMNEMAGMAGMKITHAANIETRIHSLENRMYTLERVLNDLCHNPPGFAMPPLDPAAFQRPATAGAPPPGAGLGISVSEDRQPASSFTTATTSVPPIPAIYSATNSSSHLSFGEAPTFTESIHPHATTTAPTSAVLPQPLAHSSRSTSNSTVRGATSLPQLHIPSRSSQERDEYATLISLITAEQSARMALEVKVRALSQRVDDLSSANNGSGNGTPQRLHLPVHQQEVPGTAKSLGTFSAFDDDSDDEEGGREGDMDRDNTAVEITVEDDASYSDAFETPCEEGGCRYGAFGEELRDDDGDGRHKAARTLSLSQLTLGKKAGEEVPEVPETPTGSIMSQGGHF